MGIEKDLVVGILVEVMEKTHSFMSFLCFSDQIENVRSINIIATSVNTAV